jgi:hypothetical protein
MSLLGYNFRSFAPALALSILDPKISFTEQEGVEGASTENIFGGQTPLLTPYDLKRLESYSNNLVDYHLILDLVPTVARLYFLERLPASLSYGQAAILLCLGLQHQQLEHLEVLGLNCLWCLSMLFVLRFRLSSLLGLDSENAKLSSFELKFIADMPFNVVSMQRRLLKE